ncbi:hypothetical protein VCRA2116O30_420007 [Vibrio crassostreae]|nr:hypothetical protein VCRA2116O30_420007 [Vibrio crassostreae]CAK2108312.1 hypothetical protein VCRA2113O20_410017 [Vibrio crassostreae]CAK2109336.1 hypothetical protein VCRA2119O45_440016 [Vibrio crassostreae]CAK2391515.1 hypothetical protein VCRA2119O52_1010007 [Vibrio crassostreae]CAK2833140.1 hypothetical protein VCRA2125O82_260012 [Vibrio crassostreae]
MLTYKGRVPQKVISDNPWKESAQGRLSPLWHQGLTVLRSMCFWEELE